jgi:hypothetical protein
MKSFSADQLRQQRFALAAQIAQIQKETLRGSLIERYKRCGKPGCRCAQSKGHGPKYYLSVSYPGRRPQMDYVPLDRLPLVHQYVKNHQQIREWLEQISLINQELLRRRETF